MLILLQIVLHYNGNLTRHATIDRPQLLLQLVLMIQEDQVPEWKVQTPYREDETPRTASLLPEARSGSQPRCASVSS